MTKREKIIAAVFLICVLALFAGAYALRQRGQLDAGSGSSAAQSGSDPQASSQEPITEAEHCGDHQHL